MVPRAQDVGSESVACVLFADKQNAIDARLHERQSPALILGRFVARLLLRCYTLDTGERATGRHNPPDLK